MTDFNKPTNPPAFPTGRGLNMFVRKIRVQNKIGKVILSSAEAAVVRRMGVSLEAYIKVQLVHIAKKRRWKWFFNKEMNSA